MLGATIIALALANAGVLISSEIDLEIVLVINSIACLVIGKSIGISSIVLLAKLLKLITIPSDISNLQIIGVSFLEGIGFIMAIFIGGLAFANKPAYFDSAKTGILIGSLISVVAGFIILKAAPKQNKKNVNLAQFKKSYKKSNLILPMNTLKLGFAICFILFISTRSLAQEIEPRRWSPMPLKTNVIGFGYAYSYGDILFDPVLQIEDVTVSANNMIVSYVRPFKLFGKLARFDGNIPYVAAKWEGLVAGNYADVERSGFGDPNLRVSLLLNGAPPDDPKALQEYIMLHPVRTIYGFSFAVRLPLGQYYEDKLLNIGQNIFIFIPQAGLVHHWGQWSYEVTASVNFYTNNNDFINGQTKKQDPTFALQTHLVRNFKKGLWASASVSYGLGGRSVVNRTPNDDERSNIQAGGSIGFPVFKDQGVKVFYILSETLNDLGSDTNNFGLAWLIQI